MSALVSLVGAGPGDPELITLRGANRLAQADLVLYDALLAPELLDLAQRAKRFYVGKRAGRHAMPQRSIERLMVRSAMRGYRVVRLKCGDPYVFGRGGEEGLALARAGIPFEVVPGVSSAVAAPAWAGVPLTHRGSASAFLVVSGHTASVYEPIFASLRNNSVTLVIMMGMKTCSAWSISLLARGWRPDTPVAMVAGAWSPTGARWIGELEVLAELASACDEDVVPRASETDFSSADQGSTKAAPRVGMAPGLRFVMNYEGPVTFVVGDVVRLAEALDAAPRVHDEVCVAAAGAVCQGRE